MQTDLVKALGTYRFGSSIDLSTHQMNALIQLFNQPTQSAEFTLGGRGSVLFTKLEGIGSIVVKFYTRGGFNRHFNKRTYLKLGSKTRCQIEYEMLNTVRTLNVMAPEPIVWACKGNLVYRGWLVTREVKQQHTLAQLSRIDAGETSRAMDFVTVQVATLIEQSIHHVDLHPGNVLVDHKDRVYLLDFDKAHYTRKSTSHLRDKYLQRWQRAVVKHHLPTILVEKLEQGLVGNGP
jgi:3-deoxy-D-manno-octulosonic acid kinase